MLTDYIPPQTFLLVDRMEFFNDVGNGPSRPSIFELVAQEQLRDLLQPALKYVLSVSCSNALAEARSE